VLSCTRFYSCFYSHGFTYLISAASAALIAAGKKQSLPIKGPVRMPTKHLKLTVRKSPCGNVRGLRIFLTSIARVYFACLLTVAGVK
jgi:hypothetical protein